jgi:hypothetical protein
MTPRNLWCMCTRAIAGNRNADWDVNYAWPQLTAITAIWRTAEKLNLSYSPLLGCQNGRGGRAAAVLPRYARGPLNATTRIDETGRALYITHVAQPCISSLASLPQSHMKTITATGLYMMLRRLTIRNCCLEDATIMHINRALKMSFARLIKSSHAFRFTLRLDWFNKPSVRVHRSSFSNTLRACDFSMALLAATEFQARCKAPQVAQLQFELKQQGEARN